MKRAVLGLVAALLWAFPALGQIPGGSEIAINRTPVVGGTALQCLYVTSTNKVGNQACGGTAAGITVGTSAIAGGTTTRILYDNAGVLGEYTISGSGTVVAMQTGASLITPALGVATATSLAIGGATIGSNGLAVTGSTALGDGVTITPATANTTALTITGGSVTTAVPLISATRTWNNSGVTFTSLLYNITDTASAAGSLLIDLQVGSATKFNISKAGTLTTTGDVVSGPASASTGNVTLLSSATFPTIQFKNGSTVLTQMTQNAAGSNFFWDIPTLTINWRDTLNGGATVATLNSSGVFTATGLITAKSGTAVGAGANTQAFIKGSSTANLGVYYGTGDPGFSAAKGSLYVKTDATTVTTRLWVNTDGGTTWTFFTSGA